MLMVQIEVVEKRGACRSGISYGNRRLWGDLFDN